MGIFVAQARSAVFSCSLCPVVPTMSALPCRTQSSAKGRVASWKLKSMTASAWGSSGASGSPRSI